MSAGYFGYLLGGFVVPVFVAAVWLIITKLIKPLGRRPKLVYSVTAILGWLVVLPTLITSVSPSIGGIAGALGVSWYAWYSYKKKTSVPSDKRQRPMMDA